MLYYIKHFYLFIKIFKVIKWIGDQNKKEPKTRRINKNKISLGKRKYDCKICEKKYYSYSSLYTHFRNKHNIVTVTKRDDIFGKVQDNNNFISFNYTASIKNINLDEALCTEITEKINKIFFKVIDLNRELFANFYGEKIWNFETFKKSNYGFINCIKNFFNEIQNYKKKNNNVLNYGIYNNKILTQKNNNKSQNKENDFEYFFALKNSLTIDDVFIKYLILFKQVVKDEELLEEAILFVILLREFLNISGNDLLQKYLKFNIIPFDSNLNKGFYTEKHGPQFIPEFINNFLDIFLNIFNLTNFVEDCKEKIKSISFNFCNWLYSNNLTNCKLVQL